jgi:chemotaxis protein methyltransferase CheR
MTEHDPVLSQHELDLLNEFFSERYGLQFPISKREILQSRLRPRLQAHGLRRFIDYYYLLQFGLNGSRNEELENLIGSITNNETYFFRETQQFEALFNEALDDLKKTSPFGLNLRFLCAGCSSGEEAYTLNIFAVQNKHRLGRFAVSIDAFDLDREKIRCAGTAEYGRRSLRSLDQDRVKRYFSSFGDDRFLLKALFRDGVRFSQGNLLNRNFVGLSGVYDVVFCRNVLIYFSDPALSKAIDNFAHWLRPGGLLFLGHSESIIGRDRRFRTLRLGNTVAYQRQ